MTNSSRITTDLVLSPFGASARELIEVAKCADESVACGQNESWKHESRKQYAECDQRVVFFPANSSVQVVRFFCSITAD